MGERPSDVHFRLPLDGPITVGWGGPTVDVNYHVVSPAQRWAYDLLVTRDGRSHQGIGEQLEDYYCYGLPVLAPSGGTVRATFTDAREMPIGQLGGTPTGGNQIVLEVAPQQFLFLCHLQPGSIAVQPGDQVAQGQMLAKVGNSGNTSEPHLHIHLQDTEEEDLGEGIPLYFHSYQSAGRFVDRGLPRGGFTRGQLVGEIVEHVAEARSLTSPPK
ncbi:MAG: M23 family metallopeptidase [Planctomycetales bacterium]|nr:M23 family metallopeptidase [Planctomycetales bacterium]